MSMYETNAASAAVGGLAPAWSDDEFALMMALFNFNTAWIPVLLLVTMMLISSARRRPGRLLTAGFLGRIRSMRRRMEELRTALEGIMGPGRSVPDMSMLAVRMTEQKRWEVACLWLFGPSALASAVMLYGALGGWGGQIRLWPVVSALLFLVLTGAAAGAEAWSRRRADPYGNAVRRGTVALEVLVREDSTDSHLRTVWQALRSNDRRPAAYFSVDWTFRTVEDFCLSMERLARYAVRSGDPVGRARRESRVRVFVAHVQEALDCYRDAADAHAADNASDIEVRAARCRVVALISEALAHLCRDRVITPELEWDDLPEDRRNASALGTGRRTFLHTGVAVLILAALAAVFTWAGVPGEFVSPVLVALGGMVAVLLPRARWPE